MPQDPASDLLRSNIEEAVGRKLRTPKDFDFLAASIFDKLHLHISPTTLKRVWGYLHDTSSAPRQTTLDLLAQFIDYPSFKAFADAHTASTDEAQGLTATGAQAATAPTASPSSVGTSTADTSSPSSTITPPNPTTDRTESAFTTQPSSGEAPLPSPSHSDTPPFSDAAIHPSAGAATPHSARRAPFFTQLSSFFIRHSSFVILLVLLLAIVLPFAMRSHRASDPSILRLGTKFSSYEAYLKRFNLKPDKYLPYYTQHPEYPHIYFWGPEYHHPVWHNDGDSAAMMPTITTTYRPDDYPTDSASLAQLAIRNKERYLDFIAERPVLITFMKDLVDTSYVFLGVYVLSSRSDTTYQVWERMADDIDINHLERLERYHY